MRIESKVTSVTWIPSEAILGMSKLPFEMGVAHYDEPPPEVIANIEGLRESDRFRFANVLRGWIEVEDGRIVAHGQDGAGLIGATTVRLGSRSMSVAAVALPDRRPQPTVGPSSVRFVQNAGGRTGLPMPRAIRYPPFVQISSPWAWTSLSLTLNTEGSAEYELLGASPFPRHWIYGADDRLAQKTGLIDFKDWAARAVGMHTPWGDQDSPALVTQIETALEHELSARIMRGGRKPEIRKLKSEQVLVREGEPGEEMFLLLDGVLAVDVGGHLITHLGPGVIVGERALLERGRRTATLKTVTPVRVAVVRADQVEPEVLTELATHHRREVGPA
ncbi:MAG TPA: cyclic nucleotide-binding domain-containing protein [Candidatus Dormibacteraeota bacterium]|jgi:hypothetical protein|nr:cyclic nucleotide-binding domain-containing protein [Candidatus Dormibacteraeota bacterium]